jgi:hypothetical protein
MTAAEDWNRLSVQVIGRRLYDPVSAFHLDLSLDPASGFRQDQLSMINTNGF